MTEPTPAYALVVGVALHRPPAVTESGFGYFCPRDFRYGG